MRLDAGEVHVWTFRFEALPAEIGDDAADPALLSDVERSRAASMRVARARQSFLVSRTLLRRTLSRYAGVAPHALPIRVLPSGKPRLESPEWLRFNLAHSEKIWVLAVARDREVGVDVEDFDRRTDVDAVARRLFAPAEIAALAALEGEARRRAFFRVWAQREAVVKAIGAGMLESGASFTVEGDPAKPPHVEGRDLAMAEFALAEASVCIVAREGGEPPLVLRGAPARP